MSECATASPAFWPLSLRLVHWLSAVLVLAALGLGTIMVQFVPNPAVRFELTQTHKSIGITILALTVLRLCRRLFSRAPKPEPAARSLLIAAKATHLAHYALGADARLRLVYGDDHAGTRPDRRFRLVRVALSHGTGSGDLSRRSRRPCRAGDPPICAYRVARWCRDGPRTDLARPDTRAHVAPRQVPSRYMNCEKASALRQVQP